MLFRSSLPWWVVLLLVATASSASAQSSAVLVHDISPGGLVPGAVTRLTVKGAALETARSLWTSIPTTVKRVAGPGDGASQATFDVTVPATSVGRAAIRVVADAGLSNVRLVLLDALPGLDESRVGEDRVVSRAAAVDGTLEAAADRISTCLNPSHW